MRRRRAPPGRGDHRPRGPAVRPSGDRDGALAAADPRPPPPRRRTRQRPLGRNVDDLGSLIELDATITEPHTARCCWPGCWVPSRPAQAPGRIPAAARARARRSGSPLCRPGPRADTRQASQRGRWSAHPGLAAAREFGSRVRSPRAPGRGSSRCVCSRRCCREPSTVRARASWPPARPRARQTSCYSPAARPADRLSAQGKSRRCFTDTRASRWRPAVHGSWAGSGLPVLEV